jgi:AI-2 transport protein TqsA
MENSERIYAPLAFIAVILGVAALYFARDVVIVLLLTVLVVYTVDPLVVFLHRRKVPFWLATLAALLLFACLFLGFFVLILRDFSYFAKTFPGFQKIIFDKITLAEESFEKSLGAALPVNPLEALSRLQIGSVGMQFVRSAAGILSESFLIFFFAAILLIGKYRVIRKILTVFPRRHSLVPIVLRDIDQHLRAFLGVKALSSLLIGIGTAALLLAFRIEFAVTWGLLALLANFVPTLGPIVAVLVPGVISAVQHDAIYALETAASLAALHLLVSNLIEPRLMGERLDLSFFAIFVSLFFWGWMWGAAGVLLAVPVTASIKIVLERIPTTARIGLLLGRYRANPDRAVRRHLARDAASDRDRAQERGHERLGAR